MGNNKIPENSLFLNFDCKKVANLLKKIVNQSFGFEVHENIGEMPNMFDLAAAISVLDGEETKKMEIRMEDDDDKQ